MAIEGPQVATWALQSALEGLSANEGLRQYREAGGHVARSTWLQARGEVEAGLAAREGIYNEPLHLIPVAGEIQSWSTTGARGYAQQVEVLVRDRATNTVISVPYTSMGSELRSRQAIINEALEVYSDDNAKKYNQQILGAIYTGTYAAIPQGEK